LHNNARDSGVTFELYLAEGRGHGVATAAPRDFGWLFYAADFLSRVGIIDKLPAPEVLPANLRKYQGEPVESIAVKPDDNPSKTRRKRNTPSGVR
jgi:hypothetical protein